MMRLMIRLRLRPAVIEPDGGPACTETAYHVITPGISNIMAVLRKCPRACIDMSEQTGIRLGNSDCTGDEDMTFRHNLLNFHRQNFAHLMFHWAIGDQPNYITRFT
ncbi:hypothetical protein D3C81_1354970 [compost metagenome]